MKNLFIILYSTICSSLSFSQCPEINLQNIKSDSSIISAFENQDLGLDDTHNSKYEIDIRMYVSGFMNKNAKLYRFYCKEGDITGQMIQYDTEFKIDNDSIADYNLTISKKMETLLGKSDAKDFLDTLHNYLFFSMKGFTDTVISDTSYNETTEEMILKEYIFTNVETFDFKFKVGESYREFSFVSPFSYRQYSTSNDLEIQNICNVIEYMAGIFEESEGK